MVEGLGQATAMQVLFDQRGDAQRNAMPGDSRLLG
jgi:hypothetical protein